MTEAGVNDKAEVGMVYRFVLCSDAMATREAMFGAGRLYTLRLSRLRRSIITLASLGGVVLTMGGAVFWVVLLWFAATGALDWRVVIAGVPLAFLQSRLPNLQYLWLAELANEARLGDGSQVQIGTDGVVMQAPDADWRMGWSAIDAIHEGKLAIGLVTGGGVIPLPRASLPDGAAAAILGWHKASQERSAVFA